MTARNLFDAIGLVDDELIEAADRPERRAPRPRARLAAPLRRAAAFVSRCMVCTHEAGAPTREGVLLERCLAHVLDAPEGVRTVPLREG